MKKFTTIALGLMLGGLGFSASAALVPISISPEDGETLYGYPAGVTIIFDGILDFDEDIMATVYNSELDSVVNVYPDFYVDGDMDWETWEPIITGPTVVTINYDNEFYDEETNSYAGGQYKITLPAGFVFDPEDETNTNEEIILTYNLIQTVGWDIITPDPFEWDANWNPVSYQSAQLADVEIVFYSDLDKIVTPQLSISCTQESDDEEIEGPRNTRATVNNGILDPSLVTLSNGVIHLDLSGLSDGQWYINIPAGFAVTADGKLSNEVSFSYTIWNGLPTPTITSGPKDYGTYANGYLPPYLVLTWEGYTISKGNYSGIITLYDTNKGTNQSLTLPESAFALRAFDSETFNSIEIAYAQFIPGDFEGSVSVYLPQGIVQSDNMTNKSTGVGFYIQPAYEGEPTFTNNEGEVTIVWGDLWASYNNTEEMYLIDSEGNLTTLLYESPWDYVPGAVVFAILQEVIYGDDVYEDLKGFIVDLNALKLKDGDYTLYVPGSYASIVTEDYSERYCNITATWAFSVVDGEVTEGSTAIKAIESLNAAEGVYNLQGVKVANSLEGLAKGIYIINGKKVAVTK